MSKYLKLVKVEYSHLIGSPFKIVSILIYAIAVIYGCQNGYSLFKKQNEEILIIKNKYEEAQGKMLVQYEEIEKNIIEKPRRDPTTPYWAIWNTPSYAIKYPSPMIVFSIGQTEQYGYYKRVTNWSTVFDNDLAQEIANPERLAMGTLDFSFVLLFLTPILLIILLFNIGGLERDFGFDQLIYINNVSKDGWLFSRFLYYLILVFLLLCVILIPYGVLSGVLQSELINFFTLFLFILGYLLLWFLIFYIINYWGRGSVDQAIKMISFWMISCIIAPGLFHQTTSLKYSTNYMVDYLDVARDQRYEIFGLSTDSLQLELLKSFPDLKNTLHAADSILNKTIINRSISGLVNILNKRAAQKIERINDEKNRYVKSYFILNPIIYFQNKINEITKTDFYAYKNYRAQIQSIIDKKIDFILKDTWNKVEVDKSKYLLYIESFNN